MYHFLDCLNASTGWDLTLMGVMGGAVTVNMITFELFRRVKLMPITAEMKLKKECWQKIANIRTVSASTRLWTLKAPLTIGCLSAPGFSVVAGE